MSEKAEREKQVLKTLKQLQQQIAQQEQILNEVLVEIKKDKIPFQPSKQQEPLLNEVLVETKREPIPSAPLSSKSPLTILENLDLDMEKLTKIALFISSLYIDSNKDKVQTNKSE